MSRGEGMLRREDRREAQKEKRRGEKKEEGA